MAKSSKAGNVPTFGTDGVRGVANSELTVELSLALGRAVAKHVGDSGEFLVGRDTRVSGPLLQAGFSAGLASVGLDVIDLGVLPTPAIAFHASRSGRPAAVVSASHNPFGDNGIKLFGSSGRKLPEAVEADIAADMNALLDGKSVPILVSGAQVGNISRHSAPAEAYVERLRSRVDVHDVGTLRVVVDCANGAAGVVAPLLFEELGVDATVLNSSPDGTNINLDCGSTHPGKLQDAVRASGADLGLALDGDADRVIAVDENGEIVDGDHLIAMLALDAKRHDKLAGNTVVVTVMTNLGFRLAMERAGIVVHETKVGDKYVAEALEANGWSLGGEQSGHVIFPEFSTTGDGLLSGLSLMSLLGRSSRPLSELAASAMTRLPQVLQNVRVTNKGLESHPSVRDAVRNESVSLGDTGRVLLRPSGTEPLIRVMVESRSIEVAQSVCERLCEVVRTTDGDQ